ncbi:hypothetical protein ES703_49963 [subsurface metagenome]
MPQEATTPKEWKNGTKSIGKGILRVEKIMFVDAMNPALRLATKEAFANCNSAYKGVKTMKATAKIAVPLMKARAGDQKSTPATKMPAITKLMRPVKVKREFISSWGFSA